MLWIYNYRQFKFWQTMFRCSFLSYYYYCNKYYISNFINWTIKMFFKILGVIIVIPSLPKKADLDLPRWLHCIVHCWLAVFQCMVYLATITLTKPSTTPTSSERRHNFLQFHKLDSCYNRVTSLEQLSVAEFSGE